MTKYFVSCRTLDELKKVYKHLAQKHHPDVGGDTRTMQEINAEYEARFEVLKRSQNEQAAEDTTGKARATTESAGDFIAIIDHLLKLDGGDTKKHKEALKACGCRWSSSKKLWNWHFAEDGDKWHRGSKSMSQIRSKYGSTTFTRGGSAAGTDALPA